MTPRPHDAPAFHVPTSPSDLANIPPRALMNVWLNHHEAVRIHAPNRDEHAVAGLAIGSALVDFLLAERWPMVGAALQSGATLDQVATACGLDAEHLRVLYAAVITGEVVAGRVTPAERDQLLALLDDGPR